jgi:hypothetical protein
MIIKIKNSQNFNIRDIFIEEFIYVKITNFFPYIFIRSHFIFNGKIHNSINKRTYIIK